MTIRECYTVLEVEPGASLADVKRSWKLLAAVWHPDRFQNNANLRNQAEQKLKRINAAYDQLRDHLSRGGPPPDSDDRQSAGSDSDQDGSIWRSGCLYGGGDPRLRQVGLQELWRRHAVVQVSAEGVLLVTLNQNEPDEAVAYPKDVIIELQVGHEHWGKPSLRINDPLNYEPPRLAGNRAVLVAKDSNGIVERVRPELEFRDDYLARIFRDQVRALCCPVDLVATARAQRTEAKARRAEAQAQREAERRQEAERRRQAERRQEFDRSREEAEQKRPDDIVREKREEERQRQAGEQKRKGAEVQAERVCRQAEEQLRASAEHVRSNSDKGPREAVAHVKAQAMGPQGQREAPQGRGDWVTLLSTLSLLVFVPFLLIVLADAFMSPPRGWNQNLQAKMSAAGQRPRLDHQPAETQHFERDRPPSADHHIAQKPPTSDIGQIIQSAWQALKVSDHETALGMASQLDGTRPATANLYRGWVFLEQRRDPEAYEVLLSSANERNTMAWVSLAALAVARKSEGLPPLGPSAAEFAAEALRSDRSDAAAHFMQHRLTLSDSSLAEVLRLRPDVSDAELAELDQTPYRKVWRFFEVLGWKKPAQ